MKARKKDLIWNRVKRDFPHSRLMQNVHYAQLKIREETKGMSDKEFIDYIHAEANKGFKQKKAK